MLAVVLSVIVAALPVQQDVPASSEKPAEKQECQISGTVVRRDAGEPLKNARLTLEPETQIQNNKRMVLRTAADGKFCFTSVAPGRYRFGAERNGYIKQMYGAEDAWSQGAILTIEKGQKIDPILFRMATMGVITGKVLDEDGEPAPNLMVQALAPTEEVEEALLDESDGPNPSKGKAFAPVALAATNDLGEFRLIGLPPGRYLVSAAESSFIMGNLGLAGGILSLDAGEGEGAHKASTTYYPGVTRPEQASSIELKAGGEAVADMQLQHEQMLNVSGTVTREDGSPAPGTLISVVPVDSSVVLDFGNFTATTEENGQFTLRQIPAGTYILQARFLGDAPQHMLSAHQRIEVQPEGNKNLHIVVGEGMSVSGKITVESGPPQKISDWYLRFRPTDEVAEGASGEIDKDGNFKAGGLEPGAYVVSISRLPEKYFLKRITYGGHTSKDGTLTVPSEGISSKIELLVSPNGAAIEGIVQNAKQEPVGGTLLLLQTGAARDKRREVKARASSDQHGKFYFRGLAPGTYTVATRKRAKDSQSGPPSATVTLSEGEQKTVTIKLE